ncbi:MAG TPA: hypothetical protein VF316_20535 [Polyangiaceae bacterium]
MNAYRYVSTLTAFAALTALAVGAGCSAIQLDGMATEIPPGPTNTDGGTPDGGNYLLDAGADGILAPSAASKLCEASGGKSVCSPDVSKQSLLAPVCGGDAGASSSDGGGYPTVDGLACRVVSIVLDPNHPTTAPECAKAGTGEDGAACTTGSDCRAGFECVGDPGRCRHYCCDSTVCPTLDTMGKAYFCDVQTETAASVTVPVCQVVQPCDLLRDTCAAGMTCALVDANDGVTSCVATGPAGVGQSCDVTHCGANLSCLGLAGSRTCQELCDSTHLCPKGLSCVAKWQSLKQLGVGLCQ